MSAEFLAMAEMFAEMNRVVVVLELLDRGDRGLAMGSHAEAMEAYRSVAEREHPHEWDPSGQLRARALWGLALTYLMAEEPERDMEEARRLLRTLEAFSHTPQGAQARWLGATLDEIGRLRTQAADQRETIEVLNQTVERLKQIDLNRRPGGAPAPTPARPDSVATGSRP